MIEIPNKDRISHTPTQLIDRSKTVEFDFNGRKIQAYEGDTVSSALYSSGVRIHSRSFKYHRPRGLLCAAGRCPNCLMTIDEIPNVRACIKPVKSGMIVRSQNAWPSLNHDLFSITDKLDRLLPVGFYYKNFHTPKGLWNIVRPAIRRLAGLGAVSDKHVPEIRFVHEHRQTDVLVIGGGASGMSAASAAAQSGARVILVDNEPSLGGYLRTDFQKYPPLPTIPNLIGYEIANHLKTEIVSNDKIEVLSNSSAFGYYEGNLIAVSNENGITKIRAKHIIFATGSYEIPLAFDRNDLPGVMLSTGTQRLANLYGINLGSTVMVITTGDQGYTAALDLLNAGIRIAVVADSRPEFPYALAAANELRSYGILILPSHILIRGEGVRKVIGGTVARLQNGEPTTEERQFDCDLIAMSGGFQPAHDLIRQTGHTMDHEKSRDTAMPYQLSESLSATGGVCGTTNLRTCIAQGQLAGVEAAKGLELVPSIKTNVLRRQLKETQPEVEDIKSPPQHIIIPRQGTKKFVCFCEDVTVKDIEQAINEGFDDIQTLKRYTTTTMGPCQGKMCHDIFAQITAKNTDRTIEETGKTTSRPPIQPVSLGALAGRRYMPIKKSPLDETHQSLGASMTDSGGWRRPHNYGSPQKECMLVREKAGIIDVSTLGKLDIQGHDAPDLLDKVYTHRFSNLRPGQIRYGMLCADNGTIMDDGTVTRVSENQYFVTTSTANIEIIEEWFKWWIAGTGSCAHITNLTGALAAINIAGPRARDILSELTDVDLDPNVFRYMRYQSGEVAGIPTTFLRVGFVGETGWELHFPAEYSKYMWETIMEAGEKYGIGPFGVEAQRILRLEKKHIIPSQDTDLLSTPLDSDSSWVVKFDKKDFIGKRSLVQVRDRGSKAMLVGFVMPSTTVPEDGDPVILDSNPVGRVTSARLSPTLGKGIGFATIPTELGKENNTIQIRVGKHNLVAKVTLEPFYDPKGKKVRE